MLWASRWPSLASTQIRTPQAAPGSSQLSSSTGTPSSSPSLKPAWLESLGTSVLSSASLDHLGMESCCPALSPVDKKQFPGWSLETAVVFRELLSAS